jgi:hypothetical protein
VWVSSQGRLSRIGDPQSGQRGVDFTVSSFSLYCFLFPDTD